MGAIPFELVHGQLATLTTPRAIVREDHYRERTHAWYFERPQTGPFC